MNANRRRGALSQRLGELQKLVKQARKVQEGIANLSSVYKETPQYATDEAQNDVYRQLASVSKITCDKILSYIITMWIPINDTCKQTLGSLHEVPNFFHSYKLRISTFIPNVTIENYPYKQK